MSDFAKDTTVHANDCISRQAAIDLVKNVCDAIMSCCGSHYDEDTDDEVYDDVREIDAILKCNKEIRIALKNMPPAQPEIVRCEECKYHHQKNCSIEKYFSLDGFCSRGKPRERQQHEIN